MSIRPSARLAVRLNRLDLRPVGEGDAAATAALMDEQIADKLVTWPGRMSEMQAQERIAGSQLETAEGRGVDFAILRHGDDRLLGWIGVSAIEPGSDVGRIGYWLGTPFHGQGFMSEAAPAALQTAAGFLRLATVRAQVYPRSLASISLLEKLGFSLIGETELYSPTRGISERSLLYSLELPREWRA